MCDADTGACPCQSGVGGVDCSSCLEGYFNYTAEGCTREYLHNRPCICKLLAGPIPMQHGNETDFVPSPDSSLAI